MPINIIGSSRSARIVANRMFRSGAKVDEMDFVMQLLCLDCLRISKVQIDSGGRRGGGSYAQLKLGTIEKKGTVEILKTQGANEKYSAFSQRGLYDTLYNSVTRRDAQYQIFKTTKTGFEFGTRRPWAYVHQKGSEKKRIPERPFLKILDSDMQRWWLWAGRFVVQPFDRPVEEG